MEASLLSASLTLVLLFLAFKFLSQLTAQRHQNLPPSPLALPVIGHLHLIREPLHRTLHGMSQMLGPIFSLRFGSRLVVVVSSPSAVEECFTKNDVVLANRPLLITGKYFGYNYTSVAVSPYGDHWRNLRRVMAMELFSAGRINAFAFVRLDEVKHLLRSLYQNSSSDFAKVELKSKLLELTFNIITRMMAGKRYYGEELANQEEAKKFRMLTSQTFEYSSASNPNDFLPFLKWIDYKNFEKNVERVHRNMDEFLQGLIDEHQRRVKTDESSMIDHLLALQESQPQYYSDEIIKGLVSNMILAGTDTSEITIEWAMSLLLNYPNVLEKAKKELDSYVGQDRLIDELNLPKLHYLQAIISETYRLFPAAPLLVPHVPSADCTVVGYYMPRDTILLVNAWAIHRDSKVWEDPAGFKPERFEECEKVETHKLMPFGMGRRACPGAGLAQRIVGLGLGSLIQCFDWKRVGEQAIDLTEGRGLTMPKLEPLELMCKPREVVRKLLSEITASNASPVVLN